METEGMEMEMLETERLELVPLRAELLRMWTEIGRASCRERVFGFV